jgi:serine/threonine protein phosphatase PrpC
MEDEYIVADGGRFVAVFDGHGGGGVSQFLKNHLYDAVRRHLHEKHWEENDALLHPTSVDVTSASDVGCSGDSEVYETPSVFSHAAAIKAAFVEIEENVLADSRLKYQGSTAVAVILHESHARNGVADDENQYPKHRTVLSANIGDSRAVLSRDGRAINLTRDHKPNDQQEKERILAMGETIQWDRLSKVYRVRNLSLSRAIGDKYAKPVVSSEVDINHYPVNDQSDEFVILASDGLWDVMSSEDAVAYVHDTMGRGLSNVHIAKDEVWNYKLVLRRNMAKYVAREALRRGSSDNVCVVIVWLK